MKKFISEVKAEKGNFVAVAIAEAIVYFCATFGFSDYVLNTAVFKKTGWVDDARIPGSLVTSYVIPGIFIAITYVTGGIDVNIPTVVVCVLCGTIGAVFGSRMAVKIDVKKIDKIIGYAMIFSMAALIVKMIVSAGSTGVAPGLHGWQYVLMIPVCLVMGALNMFGVPCKPPLMSLFLILGVSPLATLTILMCMGVFGPVTGSITFFKSGKYQKKVFVCAAVFGSIAALIGGMFALSVNTLILTVAMLIAMAFVAYTMLKK